MNEPQTTAARFTPAFQKMVDVATAKGAQGITDAVVLLVTVAAGEQLTRETSLVKSSLLVAFEDIEGSDAVDSLMDRLDAITTTTEN